MVVLDIFWFCCSSRRRHTRCALVTGVQTCALPIWFWGAFAARDPAANQRHVAHLFDLWREGRIAPRVTETFALAQGGEAIARMAARQAIGKLVVPTVG